MPIDWASRSFNRPGQPLEIPAHLNVLKQPVLCSNSPLHKFYVVVKCSSQSINVCSLWIRKKKVFRTVIFRTSGMMLIGNQLQKYNTRSRSDTSDTAYLQNCNPNLVFYFWSPCRTSYSSNESGFFFTFTLLHLTPISSLNTSLHLGNSQMPHSPLEGGKSGVQIPPNCTLLGIDTTQNNMRKPQTALKLPENF